MNNDELNAISGGSAKQRGPFLRPLHSDSKQIPDSPGHTSWMQPHRHCRQVEGEGAPEEDILS